MWAGIFYVGAIMAAGTLAILDASLPGGLIDGSGDMRYAQTMAFNTLVLFSLFTVFNARSDERSAFAELFTNAWLWGAVLLSLVLQAAVIYVPFLQHAFSTVPLGAGDWLLCAAVASSVLWLRELSKLFVRKSSVPDLAAIRCLAAAASLEDIPDLLVGVVDPHFEQAAMGLAAVLRQARVEDVLRLLVQQQVVVARVRPRDVPGHAVTRSGTGFTLSRAVYQGIRMKNRKYTMVHTRATQVATSRVSRIAQSGNCPHTVVGLRPR